MARFTESAGEEKHFVTIANAIPLSTIIGVTLKDGRVLEGVMRGSSQGNNAGEGGKWKYYGEVKIETVSRETISIDYLDIESVKPLWAERADEYERLGLIKILYRANVIHADDA